MDRDKEYDALQDDALQDETLVGDLGSSTGTDTTFGEQLPPTPTEGAEATSLGGTELGSPDLGDDALADPDDAGRIQRIDDEI